MLTGTISSVAQVGGVSIQGTVTRTASGQLGHTLDLPAAKAGTLTTRDVISVMTFAQPHGLEEDDVIDVYWSGGIRYGMIVTGHDELTVSIEGGEGEELPIPTTAVTAAKISVLDTDFAGDLVELIEAMCTSRGQIVFRDAVGRVAAPELLAREPWRWASGQGIANPLAGKLVDTIRVSNGSSAAAAIFKLGLLYESQI